MQELPACSRKCKAPPWQGPGHSGPLRAPQPPVSLPAPRSQSVFESGQLYNQGSPSSEPASLVKVRRKGEETTEIFRKTRKMTSLATSPRRKPSVPRRGAHRNGLRDVEEARTSHLLPPESHRFCSRLSPPAKHFAERYGKILRKNMV